MKRKVNKNKKKTKREVNKNKKKTKREVYKMHDVNYLKYGDAS